MFGKKMLFQKVRYKCVTTEAYQGLH